MSASEVFVLFAKYFGLALAAASSVWSLVSETSTKNEAGKKVVTRAGYLSIFFVALGLVINLVSGILSGHLEFEKSQKRLADERFKYMRLASSSQPLQSIELSWSFGGIDLTSWKEIEERAREVDEIIENDDDHKALSDRQREEWSDDLRSAYISYPWWALLAAGKWSKRPFGKSPQGIPAVGGL